MVKTKILVSLILTLLPAMLLAANYGPVSYETNTHNVPMQLNFTNSGNVFAGSGLVINSTNIAAEMAKIMGRTNLWNQGYDTAIIASNWVVAVSNIMITYETMTNWTDAFLPRAGTSYKTMLGDLWMGGNSIRDIQDIDATYGYDAMTLTVPDGVAFSLDRLEGWIFVGSNAIPALAVYPDEPYIYDVGRIGQEWRYGYFSNLYVRGTSVIAYADNMATKTNWPTYVVTNGGTYSSIILTNLTVTNTIVAETVTIRSGLFGSNAIFGVGLNLTDINDPNYFLGNEGASLWGRSTSSKRMAISNGSYGAIQRGYANGGNFDMDVVSYGSEQAGIAAGGARMYLKAAGAMQRGSVDDASTAATNLGVGAIQLLDLDSGERALTTATGDGSILLGAGTASNKYSIVAGDGQESHGTASISAATIWGSGTNLGATIAAQGVTQTTVVAWQDSMSNRVVTTNMTDVTLGMGLRLYTGPGGARLEPAGASQGIVLMSRVGHAVEISDTERRLGSTNGDTVASFFDVFRVGGALGTNIAVYSALTNLGSTVTNISMQTVANVGSVITGKTVSISGAADPDGTSFSEALLLNSMIPLSVPTIRWTHDNGATKTTNRLGADANGMFRVPSSNLFVRLKIYDAGNFVAGVDYLEAGVKVASATNSDYATTANVASNLTSAGSNAFYLAGTIVAASTNANVVIGAQSNAIETALQPTLLSTAGNYNNWYSQNSWYGTNYYRERALFFDPLDSVNASYDSWTGIFKWSGTAKLNISNGVMTNMVVVSGTTILASGTNIGDTVATQGAAMITNGQQGVTLGLINGTTVADATATNQPVTLSQLNEALENFSQKTLFGVTNAHPTIAGAGSLWSTNINSAWTNIQTHAAASTNLAGVFWNTNCYDTVRAGNYIGRFFAIAAGGGTKYAYIQLVYSSDSGATTNIIDTSAQIPIGTTITSYRLTADNPTDITAPTALTNICLGIRYYTVRTGGGPSGSVTTYGGEPYDAHLETPGLGPVSLESRGATNVTMSSGFGGVYDTVTRVMALTNNSNLNMARYGITNVDYLQSTNYVQTGTGAVMATVGAIRIGESSSTNQGIWFGGDAFLYRSQVGYLTTKDFSASSSIAGAIVYASSYYSGAWLGDTLFRNGGADNKRWIWQNVLGNTNLMTLTNNAGIGQLEVGNVVVTNAIYCGSIAGRVTNYFFYVSNTNWAGTWADYAGYYHGINSNNTIRITTNLWGF